MELNLEKLEYYIRISTVLKITNLTLRRIFGVIKHNIQGKTLKGNTLLTKLKEKLLWVDYVADQN